MASGPHSSIHISAYALSDPGRRREKNEDQWLVLDLTTGARGLVAEALEHAVGRRGTLLAVADGMGGAPGGDLASSVTMESLLRDLGSQATGPTALHVYHQAINHANRWIWEIAQADDALQGMGATLTTCLIYYNWVYVAQVGDSRAYLVRQGQCHQITEDQSLLDAMIATGQLTPGEARSARGGNVMLQALGTHQDIQIAITEVELQNDDILVLCTDGLFRLVSTEEIGQILTESTTPKAACEELIARANGRGGPDNITVVTARIRGISQKHPMAEPSLNLNRLTLFDPSEILQRNPQLQQLALSKVKERRIRSFMLVVLLVLLIGFLVLLAFTWPR